MKHPVSAALLAWVLSITCPVHALKLGWGNLAPALNAISAPAVQSEKLKAKVVDVFYNVYVGPSQSDAINAADIVNEQLSKLIEREKKGDVVFNIKAVTIGQSLQHSILPEGVRIAHYRKGNEGNTLQFLYEHCLANTASQVMYLHNKGSFHKTKANEVLRRFLMNGVLSDPCLYMSGRCSTCSARWSPLPHPHTPGNMWVAKCQYIATLSPPKDFDHRMQALVTSPGVPKPSNVPSQMGTGRYAFEHWVQSAPTVVPCDVYQGEYKYGYNRLPSDAWVPQLHVGLRFPMAAYDLDNIWKKPQIWRSWRCFEYRFLYHQDASDATRAALGIGAC